MSSSSPTVANVLLSQMSQWGIQHIYGVAGDAIIPLLDAIHKQNQIQYFAVRHESSAAFMASTEGKLTSNIGVCIGTSGPGLANMLNGIADAAADRIPMLVITGQVKRDQVGTEAKQYIDQEQLIQPLAVYSASLLHPDAALTVMNKAIIEAISKKGVAHISIPKDVLALPCPLSPRSPTGLLQKTIPSNLSQLDACVKALKSAKKPTIYIGKGARGASAPIIELAERLHAGILETLGAKGTVPYDHELYIGGIGDGGTIEGSELLKDSDCILIIGATWYPDMYVPKGSQVIKVDISPASIESQKDITFGLVGDALEIVNLLLSKIAKTTSTDWLTTVKNTKTEIDRRLNQERQPSGSTITPQLLMGTLEQSIAKDAIIALDTGDHTIWFNRFFRAHQQTVTFSGKWRTMGYGLPAAISAKLQYPDKEVTAIVGDGSFLMTSMELSTLVKYGTPVKIIVVNNSALAAEKSKMLKAGLQPYGVELTNPDFAKLASSYGIKSYLVTESNSLADTLKEMYADDGSALVEVQISDIPPID